MGLHHLSFWSLSLRAFFRYVQVLSESVAMCSNQYSPSFWYRIITLKSNVEWTLESAVNNNLRKRAVLMLIVLTQITRSRTDRHTVCAIVSSIARNVCSMSIVCLCMTGVVQNARQWCRYSKVTWNVKYLYFTRAMVMTVQKEYFNLCKECVCD